MGIRGVIKSNDEDKTITTKELLAKVDALFDREDYRSIYDLLSTYKDSKDVEILWRLSKAIYKMSETASDVEARKLIYEGYDLLCTALDIQEDHYDVHKWICIFLIVKTVFEDIKAQIKETYNIKKHMQRALELKPGGDALMFYMLGSWCYEISNTAWYQRITSLIFGEPPILSFEEALTYLENAKKADPNFYSLRNLLMLGKTYLKLDRKEDAVTYLKKAAEFPAKNDEDQTAKQEAQKILSIFDIFIILITYLFFPIFKCIRYIYYIKYLFILPINICLFFISSCILILGLLVMKETDEKKITSRSREKKLQHF